jgi:hypothetical protein
MLRLIVCGGWDYQDRKRVWDVLDRIRARRGIALVIEGGAAGADRLAREWAQSHGVGFETVKAMFARDGLRAGPMRNCAMLALEPDGVVAFPGGPGTRDMVKKARKAGVTVMEVKDGAST